MDENTPTAETCNQIDDDCNGVIDDVPLVSTSCTVDGINTRGACRAMYAQRTARPAPADICTRVNALAQRATDAGVSSALALAVVMEGRIACERANEGKIDIHAPIVLPNAKWHSDVKPETLTLADFLTH